MGFFYKERMITLKDNVGIVGLGVYVPEKYMDALDIAKATNGVWTEEAVVEKLGIVKKPIPGPNDGTQEMAVFAAMDCLNRTGVDPKTIDVILSIGEEWKEYPLTTSALYVQDKIGAINAWGIDLQNRCSTGVSAIKIAKDMMISDKHIKRLLIVGGYRNGDFVDYTDKGTSFMYNLGAGGGAMLLERNYGKNLLLGSHIMSDGSMSRDAGLLIGGHENPITRENLDVAYKSLRLMNPVNMKNRLNDISMTNWLNCIDKALEKSEMTRKDLNYVALLHIKRSAHLGMLEELGLTKEDSIYLENYGHVGQIDQIISLDLALKSGKVKDGDVVALVAAGIGYVWAAGIVRWG